MKLKQTFIAATVGLAALTLAACGGGADPLGGTTAQPSGGTSQSSGSSAPIVVGSASFTENEILGQIYAQALVAKGLQATTKPNLGSREVYIKALQDKSITVMPEYTGNLLKFFDKGATATTEKEIIAALPKAVGNLKVLKESQAADQDVYVVTKAYSEQNGVASLDDLKKIASNSTLGGPSELKDRPYGPPGLKDIYGATFKSFKPYDSPAVKVKDLNDNKIQVATFFTTDAAILDNGYVTLKDPQSMILPQQIVPLVSPEVASNATATGALEAVQAALTTDELTKLNKQVDVDHDDANTVAADWLKSKGLA